VSRYFPELGFCGFDRTAGMRAFQGAIDDGYTIILAEMQETADYISNVNAAARNAFLLGCAVIATNGNTDNSPSVAAPAQSPYVIGVGGYDYQTMQSLFDTAPGPGLNGIIKPDIQAPSNTFTAGALSSTNIRSFGGTSGAAPYAAGAAALLGWARNPGGYYSYSTPPGVIYAALIDSGQERNFNNTVGAGRIILPNQLPVSITWWGTVTLGHQQYVDVPLPVQWYTYNTLSAAAWWPDPSGQHSDVDVTLFSPAGVQDGSWTIPSVFEKVRLSPAYQNMTFTLRIWAYSLPPGVSSQTIYWSAHTRY
jgi:serine protease AprX